MNKIMRRRLKIQKTPSGKIVPKGSFAYLRICFRTKEITALGHSCLVGFLCRCCSPSPLPLNALKRCHRHQTPLPLPPLNTVSIVHHHHCCHHCCCCRATTTATTTNVVELTVVHCQRKMQQQHHHQCANASTNVKTFTNPDNLDLFKLSTVFEVCDIGWGNLVIGKLLT